MQVDHVSKPTRLLLIDRQSGERAQWRRALERSGHAFAVTEAASADEGLRLIDMNRFDCILFDHALPECNGLAFLSDLLDPGDETAPPLVLITPAHDAAAAVRALKLGAADIVVKGSPPASPDSLPAVILRILRERRRLYQHRRVEAELLEAEAKYRNLVEHLPFITYTASLDEPGRLLSISPQAKRLGRSLKAWLAAPGGMLGFIHPADRSRVVEALSVAYGEQTVFRCEYRLLGADGQSHWVRDHASIVRGQDGRPLCIQGTLIDSKGPVLDAFPPTHLNPCPSAHRSAPTRNRDEPLTEIVPETPLAHTGRFRLLLESTEEGFLELDREGRCIFANQSAIALFGYSSPEELEGRSLSALLAWHRLSAVGGSASSEDTGPLHLTLYYGRSSRFLETLVRRNGHVFNAELSAYPIGGLSAQAGAVVIMRDVSEARAMAQRLSHLASHDALTGLLNRSEFERRLAKVIAEARRSARRHTLCFLDLDRFKVINDRCGHAAGDRVLQSLVQLLQSRLRQGDMLARIGGDEFGLLLENCTIQEAYAIADQLREAAREFRFPWGSEEFTLGLSVGLVALNAGDWDVAGALRAADAACYAAKRSGRDRVHLDETGVRDTSKARSERTEPSRSPARTPAEMLPMAFAQTRAQRAEG